METLFKDIHGFDNKPYQIVVKEDKGRISTTYKDKIPRPITNYERMLDQKDEEIEERNRIIEHQHKQLEVLSDLLKVENERHSKTREKLDIFEGWYKEMSEGNGETTKTRN